jgi:hypothetical protein
MKNSFKTIFLILASVGAGVVLFTLAKADFTAALPGETIIAIATSLAIAGVAVYDYAHQPQSLAPKGNVFRPPLPVGHARRSAVYGITTTRKEHAAA